jgi:hypothetical protein
VWNDPHPANLRRDDAVVELTVDKTSVRADVTRGPERGKLKNFYC